MINIKGLVAQSNLKSDEKSHERGLRDTLLFCRHVFTFFRKHELPSVSLTFCFNSKINCKTENWYNCRFHLPGFYLRKQCFLRKL